MSNVRVAVLLTCHNRKAFTLSCLAAMSGQQLPEGMSVSTFLVNDGSSDGTGEAVTERFPAVRVIQGDGSLFWAGGMMRAMREASIEDFDYYLWLNDDTELQSDAISRLVSAGSQVAGRDGRGHIIVGTTIDRRTDRTSYGGVVRRCWWHPYRFLMVEPGEQPLPCHTMNGNCVLISLAVTQQIGLIDGEAFKHGSADFDYGLRARKAGCTIWIAPGFYGKCDRTKLRQDWRRPEWTRWQRLAALVGTKGLPPREMVTFGRRHGGPFWPVFFCVPYVRALLLPSRHPERHPRAVRLKADPQMVKTTEEGLNAR